MTKHILYIYSLCLMICSVACSSEDAGTGTEEDQLIAKVHNKSLYLSELDGMFPEGIHTEDSLDIIRVYSQRWIRDALLLHEAERNIPSDLNIDKLVRDYRASLIRHNYEKILIETDLDSVITQKELAEFYEKNKEQYQLETTIARCFFIKVPLPVPESEKLQMLWNNVGEDNTAELIPYCNQHAEAFLLDKDAWYKIEDVAQGMPKGTITPDNISAKRDFIQRDESYQYYFKVFEVKNRKDIAPLSYIAEQASKVILRSRKEQLLEEKIETMYEQELRKSNIQTYY
ncbi:MAG: hypothetical protein MI974_01455 [Chitinophagales bacterium]|nr:hypothetical protein [Chitinophagales bacterium]